ncbi:MAG: hypothetical protein ABEJ64_00245 [Candidatus Nanohaloarchaea archaeon]
MRGLRTAEERIEYTLPDAWDFTGSNVVYGHPVPSDSFPDGFLLSNSDHHLYNSPVGEKDVVAYVSREGRDDIVAYIEVKENGGLEERAEDQVERACEFWNSRGYAFAGGFSTGETIRPWDGEVFGDGEIAPADFDFREAEVIPAAAGDGHEPPSGKGFDHPMVEGWDEVFTDLVYGEPLDSSIPRGLVGSNDRGRHFGQMDAALYSDEADVIGQIELKKDGEDMETIEGRLDSAHEFWTGKGYSLQGGLLVDGEIVQRDFDSGEWVGARL